MKVKFDGYRAQLQVRGGRATIRTRNGLDWTERFEALAADAKDLPDCIIDGRVVALDRKHMRASPRSGRAVEGRSEDLVFFVFDLLTEGGRIFARCLLAERKRRLRGIHRNAPCGERIRYVQHFESRADTVLLSACKMELEGVSRRDWMRPMYPADRAAGPKQMQSGPRGRARRLDDAGGGLRSLLAGVNRNGHLVYIGRIGTGYGAASAKELLTKVRALTVDKSPLAARTPRQRSPTSLAQAHPGCRIEFAGWTASGMIARRHSKACGRTKRHATWWRKCRPRSATPKPHRPRSWRPG